MMNALTDPEIKMKTKVFETMDLPHIDSVYTFALYMVGNESDAEELVQDIYLRAYKFLDRYKKGTNCKAWLLKLSVDALMKFFSLNNIITCIPQISGNEKSWITSERESSGYETTEKGSEDDVDKVIHSLPIMYRMIIMLADMEKFSYREISYIIGCPIGTVVSKLHEGHQILKEKLLVHLDQYNYQESQSYKQEVSVLNIRE